MTPEERAALEASHEATLKLLHERIAHHEAILERERQSGRSGAGGEQPS